MARILLIEDEPQVREMLLDELAEQGHLVIEAQNGIEGLKMLVDKEPDLVLCDRAMPGMSGYEVLERIRGAYPQYSDLPFVFLTALSDPRDKAAVEHLKPSAYISKPVDFTMLGNKINSLLKQAAAV
jgi:CheY-like chemotaxis protein